MAAVRGKTIVTVGGGTGSFIVVSALKNYPVRLKAIVSMADDGGSTGALRDQYGVLPPGDVRRALVALSGSSDTLRELFNYRFTSGGLAGHSFGNIFLTALEKLTGDFRSGLREASRILNIRGEVIPVTTDNVRLHARLADGRRIRGETNIDISPKRRSPIADIWLEPAARINPAARAAIGEADLIVIGPGDIYSSIIPNLLVRGMPEAIRAARAKTVFITNIMTKRGETDGFSAENFFQTVERYLGGRRFDYIFFNTGKPPPRLLRRYQRRGSEFVQPPIRRHTAGKPRYILADFLDRGPFLRHGPRAKLARAIASLLA